MHIQKILQSHSTTFSFEFFPPRTPEMAQELRETIESLSPLQPSFVSVTYGAGGSTRQLTHELVTRIQKETDLTVVCHLTCSGTNVSELDAILEKYISSGIENIMALRGDPPRGGVAVEPVADGFKNAAELVAHLKKRFPHVGVGVAGFPEGHPETPNRLKEMDYLKAKVDAGADFICTQLFFDNHCFYDFCDRCTIAGIRVPILAGVMPITSRKSMQRMAELSGGTVFPAKLLRAMMRAENDDYAEKVGIHWATAQVLDLLDSDVKGIHFYTLNRSKAALHIYEWLGVSSSQGLGQRNLE
ncbi:MAG: methylenetetrahydrofolate reductase [NAD(P)H] [Anaerolineae bacterium]